jgi:hypothetical protein
MSRARGATIPSMRPIALGAGDACPRLMTGRHTNCRLPLDESRRAAPGVARKLRQLFWARRDGVSLLGLYRT